MDIEKAKNDIVYFSENVFGVKLQEWQKDLLRKYEQGEIIWFGGNNRYKKNTIKEIIEEYQKLITTKSDIKRGI